MPATGRVILASAAGGIDAPLAADAASAVGSAAIPALSAAMNGEHTALSSAVTI